MLSPQIKAEYSNVEFILKDKAFVDFLNLPSKHNERHLHRSLSPTMIAEYQRKLIPLDVMQKSLDEYCSFLNNK